jgi:hypothetical protein
MARQINEFETRIPTIRVKPERTRPIRDAEEVISAWRRAGGYARRALAGLGIAVGVVAVGPLLQVATDTYPQPREGEIHQLSTGVWVGCRTTWPSVIFRNLSAAIGEPAEPSELQVLCGEQTQKLSLPDATALGRRIIRKRQLNAG